MLGRIAIVSDDPGWHGAQLRKAFTVRGYASQYVALSECRIDLSVRHGLRIPGFSHDLPAAVFVRGISAGTLEQVVLRLDFLHCLRDIGVPVYNSARAIERSVDKAMTSFMLSRAGIPTPATWTTESMGQARALLMREAAAGREVVIKPLFGSQGKGLRRMKEVADLPPAEEYDGVYYLQRYVETGPGDWRDWRVFVIGGRAVAAMLRRGRSWINNMAQGARCEHAVVEPRLAELAEAAARVLDMDYAGVDILRGEDGLQQVVEVNSIPAWKGLQSVQAENVAQLLANDLIKRYLPQQLEAVC